MLMRFFTSPAPRQRVNYAAPATPPVPSILMTDSILRSVARQEAAAPVAAAATPRPATTQLAPTLARRELHDWSAKGLVVPDSELVIGGMSHALAVMMALREHPSASHRDVTLVTGRHWLTRIDEAYAELEWGQTRLDFPHELQERVLGHLKNNENLRWNDARNVMLTIEQMARETEQLTYLENEVQRIVRNEDNIDVVLKDAGALQLPYHSSHIYNFAALPRTPSVAVLNERGKIVYRQSMSNDVLYSISPEHLPDVIPVIGKGQSALWAIEHFGAERILLLSQGEPWVRTPRNRHIDISRVRELVLPPSISEENFSEWQSRGYATFKDGENGGIIIDGIDRNTGRSVKVRVSEVYAAAGIVACPALTSQLVQENKSMVTVSEPITQVAPQSTPQGSLTGKFCEFVAITGNPRPGISHIVTDDVLASLTATLYHYTQAPVRHEFLEEYCKKIKESDYPRDRAEQVAMMKEIFLKWHPEQENEWEKAETALLAEPCAFAIRPHHAPKHNHAHKHDHSHKHNHDHHQHGSRRHSARH